MKAKVRNATIGVIIEPVPDPVREQRIEQEKKQVLADLDEYLVVVYRSIHVKKE